MKKRVLLLAAIMLPSLLLCACGEPELLPVPEYPLDDETVEAALLEFGFECTMETGTSGSSTEQYSERSFRLFSLENGETMGSILSAVREGERWFRITPATYYFTNAAPMEEIERFLALATRLFGALESERQVFEAFTADYGTQNCNRVAGYAWNRDGAEVNTGSIKESSSYRWGDTFGGISCQVILIQPDLEQEQHHIREIIFTTNWELFYPNRIL